MILRQARLNTVVMLEGYAHSAQQSWKYHNNLFPWIPSSLIIPSPKLFLQMPLKSVMKYPKCHLDLMLPAWPFSQILSYWKAFIMAVEKWAVVEKCAQQHSIQNINWGVIYEKIRKLANNFLKNWQKITVNIVHKLKKNHIRTLDA